MTGRVISFDDERGLGEIAAVDGRTFGFHCTAILDGTRTIPTGVDVEFELVAGPVGRTEAGRIRRASHA